MLLLILFFSRKCFRYRASVPVDFIKRELAFPDDESWQTFIKPFGLQFEDALRTKLDCKSSMACLPNMQ